MTAHPRTNQKSLVNLKMPRPVKQYKLPKTSISVSVDLRKRLEQGKKRTHTMDEHLSFIISDYYSIKEEFSFLEDAYNKSSQKNAEYVRIIKDLKQQLGNISEESARGVAAIPGRTTIGNESTTQI